MQLIVRLLMPQAGFVEVAVKRDAIFGMEKSVGLKVDVVRDLMFALLVDCVKRRK